MRIAIGEFSHEGNSFSLPHANFFRFASGGWIEPNRLLDVYRGTSSFLGGMIDTAERQGVQLVPLPTVPDVACPVLRRDTFDYVVSHICQTLEGEKAGLDGICFSLHGAGLAEGVDDVESVTVRNFRRVVGDRIPIVCTADLHGNISYELLSVIQGLFCHKENPHTDSRVSGIEAMNTLIDMLRGVCHPRMHLRHLPLLTSAAAGSTLASPMKDIKDYFAAYKKAHRLIDAAFFHGFSAADFPGSRASVLVMADGYDPAEHAEHLARYVWSLRKQMVPERLTPDEAIDRALAGRREGFALINECSDNVGAGCPGDGTYTLRALLARNEPGSVFLNFYDPEAAAQARAAGVGARVSLTLGGKTDPAFGAPLQLDNVTVLAAPEAVSAPYTSPMHLGLTCRLGATVRLRLGNVEIVVVSARKQCIDDCALTATGASLSDYRLVCLKSINHFRAFFNPRADVIVASDPPGLSGDVRTYPYQRITRPIYPLDPDTPFI